MEEHLSVRATLPEDAPNATLVGRIHLPGANGGPAVVAVRDGGVFDLTPRAPTMSHLIESEDALAIARDPGAARIGDLEPIVAASHAERAGDDIAHLLAPLDLQAVKAAGVTFVKSMLERVIEERARGDLAKARAIRGKVEEIIGGELRAIRPGSAEAEKVKAQLIAEGMWSQYLEVGIGPDAEIFTKAQPMSSVGHGAEIGVHPRSAWNNPEPEVVLVVDSKARIRGATLGNDVNLRDFEGRSALLLGKAKDNNASSAIGPFIRLFDDGFGLDDVRAMPIALKVEGPDGFVLEGSSSMREISRDVEDLVGHAIGATHQYPDGLALYCGTMFAPIEDRDEPGQGFTHKLGDVVTIATPKLGRLVNRVQHADKVPPWRMGAGALMRNLARRGYL